MFRAVFYDLDGVIRHWDEAETRSIEERHGLPAGAIRAVAFEPALLERALTGRIPDETWRLAARNAIARAYGTEAAAAIDDWSALRGRVDPEMSTLVAELRKRLRTGLLTNATTRLEADLQALQLDRAFDVVINSARVGFTKPDPRIYKVATVRIGFRPHECIYVDDTLEHVEAAAAFGMTALQFTGVADLRARLNELLG